MGEWGRYALTIILAGWVSCGGDDDDAVDVCVDFTMPARADTSACADVDVAKPAQLVACLRGSGYAGQWTVDDDGLPAYDLTIDQRCDPAGEHYSPRELPQRDPIHLVGNGRGLVAMAHASGGVELYSQDRGHKWLNRVDGWRDPEDPDFPVQLGGGFNYVVVGDQVLSTRFEDLPVADATTMQSRRFGVGYYETVTSFEGLRIRRRVFAPDAEARALVAEVTLENASAANKVYGLVEFWDVNIHQLPVELATSDLLNPSTSETIERRRRALMDEFVHTASYSAASQTATVTTRAAEAPPVARSAPTDIDYYPDPIFLAVIDQASIPDAVWLDDHELWGNDEARPIPARAGDDAAAEDRTVDIDGADQHVILAVRVPVSVPAGAAVTRRFAFGYVPGGGSEVAAVGELREHFGELRDQTIAAWRDKLVWAAFPGLEDAGVIQRELAWAAYNVIANATYDEYHQGRVVGQGGAYKYIHGLDGAIGDLALFAEALVLVDPELARETLAYALANQHASTDATPWRFPYATTGVGNFDDVGIYSQRSDAYFLVPAVIGRYVALSRDFDFLDASVDYWPRSAGQADSVIGHLRRTQQYAEESLGLGARGLIAMGTGDYADGVLQMSAAVTTPGGTSSSYNAGFVVHGFPLVADVVEARDEELAGALRDLFSSQASALNNEAWDGRWYYRGFVDNGDPLVPDVFFLEPQLFPIIAGIVSPERRDELLTKISESLETDIGAMSNLALGEASGDAIDQPLVGGIWPVANAWLTEAYSLRDPGEAWGSLIRNTLAAHAEAYPGLWYGIWTGPDSFNGPDHERPGEADAHMVTALTDYPALNAHMHASPLRALMGIMGIRGSGAGITIEPRVPTETYAVVWPRLELRSTPTSIAGTVTAMASKSITMRVLLPSGLRVGTLEVEVKGDTIIEATRDGDFIEFVLPGHANVAVAWEVRIAS